MKKEQLPEHIQSKCPDGLSDEQVEAWLLGYLARDSVSHSSISEEPNIEDGRLEKPKKLHGHVSSSQKTPSSSSSSSDEKIRIPKEQANEGLQDEHLVKDSNLQSEVAPNQKEHPSSDSQSDEIAEDRPKTDNKSALNDHLYTTWPTDSAPTVYDTVPKVDNVNTAPITVALVIGIISTFAFEFGLIPILGLIFSGRAIVYSYKNGGLRYGLVGLATALNFTYSIVYLRGSKNLSDELAFVFIGGGLLLIALVAVRLKKQNPN